MKNIRLIENFGVEKDAHAGAWDRQVSLLSSEAIESLKEEGLKLNPGAFGENIVTRGLDLTKVKKGSQFRIGESVLEVTQIGKECHTPCAIFEAAGRCIMPDMGIFAKVLKGGFIHAGSRGDYGV
ncbi:MAG: MOSC domain-containing protein [Candidatus Aminicenantes bacterium]